MINLDLMASPGDVWEKSNNTAISLCMLNNNVGAEAPLPTQSLGGDRVKSWEIYIYIYIYVCIYVQLENRNQSISAFLFLFTQRVGLRVDTKKVTGTMRNDPAHNNNSAAMWLDKFLKVYLLLHICLPVSSQPPFPWRVCSFIVIIRSNRGDIMRYKVGPDM